MNTGQMMIGIAALVLVTFTVLNFSKGSLSTQDSLIYNKEFIIATTIAESMLDEISSKAYDEEIADGNAVYSANDFSKKLKAESGEKYPNFDDIDDFNHFTKTDTIPQMGIFDITVEVSYMNDGFIKTHSQTYNKNVTVRVTSDVFVNFFTDEVDTLVVSSVYSQWKLL